MLPFLTLPEGKHFRNQRSAFEHSSFVSESVTGLLKGGCISVVEERPLVCSPLLVLVSSSGKKCLVINFHYVNRFLRNFEKGKV